MIFRQLINQGHAASRPGPRQGGRVCRLLRPGAGQLQRGVRAAAARAAQAARRVPRLLHGAGALPQHRGLRLPDDEAEVLLDGGQVTNGSAASRHVT